MCHHPKELRQALLTRLWKTEMNSNLLLCRVVVKFKKINNSCKAPCTSACQRSIQSSSCPSLFQSRGFESNLCPLGIHNETGNTKIGKTPNDTRTLEITRPDHFILKLSGLLAFVICLLSKTVVSANSNASLYCWKKNRCWLVLNPDAPTTIF